MLQIFGALSALWLMLGAAGAVELPDPIAFLQGRDAQAQTIVKQAPQGALPPALRQQLDHHINEVFDFGELSRLALGAEWDKRSVQERQRFVEVFGAIIREKNYTSFLRYYREGKISYQEKKIEGERATVQATVPLKKEKVAIGYLLRASQGQWRVYDLIIDGASTAAGYQRQYSRYLQKHTYEQLIQQLGKQLDTLRQSKS